MLKSLGNLLLNGQHTENREPSEAFVRRLQHIFGKDLHVEWNPKKERWVIEQCTGHYCAKPEANGIKPHSHLCQRIYVWLVRDEDDDSYMPLGDRVITKLQEMETERKYGTGEAALARFLQESKNFDEQQKKKQKEQAHEVVRNNRKDNRLTWNKLRMLFQRHDVARPNK